MLQRNPAKMEMQEMMERLLAEMNANTKAMQEQADPNTKAMQELQNLKFDQAKINAALKKKTDAIIANIKDTQRKTTACQEVTGANPEKIKPYPGEKETSVKQQEIPNEEVAVHSLKECRSEKTASQEATETKPDPGTMQSVEEHQEIPKEDAAVMPVGGLRKRRRDRNLAAGRRQYPKERIQASCESRRRLTVAGKKMTRRATWHGARETSSEELGPKEIVDRGVN
jgi:hypothetical protein